MSWESVPKRRDRNQRFDLLCDVAAHITLGRPNFPDQFTTSVDNGDQVFEILTRREISLTASSKCLKLRSTKYTGLTKRIFNPLSSSRSSAWSIAGRYHVFANPRILASSGMTSRVVVFAASGTVAHLRWYLLEIQLF